MAVNFLNDTPGFQAFMKNRGGKPLYLDELKNLGINYDPNSQNISMPFLDNIFGAKKAPANGLKSIDELIAQNGYANLTPDKTPIGVPAPNLPGGGYDPSIAEAGKYSFLTDPSQYSSLLGGTTAPQGSPDFSSILSNPKLFSDVYKAPTGTADASFQDYIGKINAPSSTDAVQKQLDSQMLDQILSQIDRETSGAVASNKLDFADRGLSGPGQTSDIEANAQAQLQAAGVRSKAGARSTVAQAELERQKAREAAANAAYAARYGVQANADTQARDIASRGALSDTALLNDLLKTQYQGGITQAEGAAGRALQGNLGYADLASKGRLSLADILSKKDISDADLANKLNIAMLGFTGDMNKANLAADSARYTADKQYGTDDFWTNLLKQTVTGTVGGATGGIGNALGGASSGFIDNLLKPKKKTAGVNY